MVFIVEEFICFNCYHEERVGSARVLVHIGSANDSIFSTVQQFFLHFLGILDNELAQIFDIDP
jgi:hypothetical protein